MNKYVDLTSLREQERERSEHPGERLCRLAATWAGTCRPVTLMQMAFYEQATTPYPDMNPFEAYALFNKEVIEFQKKQLIHARLEEIRKTTAVSVQPTAVVELKTDVAIPIVQGDLQKTLSNDEAMARDVATILTLNTKCEEKVIDGEKTKVVTGLTSEEQSKALFYPIDAVKVRRFYKYPGLSNINVRNDMYKSLIAELNPTGKDPHKQIRNAKGLIYYMMDELARQVSSDFRVEQPIENVAIYNAYRTDRQPERTKMWMFSYKCFRNMKGLKKYQEVWSTYLKSFQFTGGSKDNILIGYSIMDMAPGLSKVVEEAMDILTICKNMQYRAVILHTAAVVLSEILVASGIIVYCQALSQVYHDKPDEIGTFKQGKVPAFGWLPATQARPELRSDTVTIPVPTDIRGKAPQYTYQYIPEHGKDGMYYLPSMKAANGLCIMTNVDITTKFACTIPQLLERFYTAVCTRSQFPYTRVTFPNIDPMAHYFTIGCVLPQIGKDLGEKSEDFFKMASKQATLLFDKDLAAAWDANDRVASNVVKKVYSIVAEGESEPTGKLTYLAELKAKLDTVTVNMLKDGWREDLIQYLFNLCNNIPQDVNPLDPYLVAIDYKYSFKRLAELLDVLKHCTIVDGVVSTTSDFWIRYRPKVRYEAYAHAEDPPDEIEPVVKKEESVASPPLVVENPFAGTPSVTIKEVPDDG